MRLGILLFAIGAVAGSDQPPDGGFSRTLTVTGPVDLRIQSDSGRITIRPGASNRVEVTARIRVSRHHREEGLENLRKIESNPPIEQSGNVIRMGFFPTPNADRYLSIEWDLTVPPSTQVESRTDSGGQVIEGINGPVRAASDSGSLRLTELAATTGATTDSGRIEAAGIGGALTAKTDSGSVHARGVSGALDVSTDSGSVVLDQTVGADVQVRTDSGSVRLRVPAGAGYDFSARSDSGNVRIGPPMTVRGTFNRRHLEGKIGGGGHRMVIETDSGGIDIEQ